ncbi:MAG: hypothetical protein IH622_03635 [Ochrobactrum anthropi]|uniref:Uncharacterized protein n=1 Tax=Brucella anthropi TaxID=529 RepID=A0A8I0N1F4_BRUAN|nr:hypothetical protein [Brucella anthropi]MBE0559911.1 hypothetical protein [Brucella anthropi]
MRNYGSILATISSVFIGGWLCTHSANANSFDEAWKKTEQTNRNIPDLNSVKDLSRFWYYRAHVMKYCRASYRFDTDVITIAPRAASCCQNSGYMEKISEITSLAAEVPWLPTTGKLFNEKMMARIVDKVIGLPIDARKSLLKDQVQSNAVSFFTQCFSLIER